MKKLCIMKFSALGDLAQIEPFLPTLAQRYEVTLLTSPLGKSYFEDSIYIKDFIVLKSKKLTDVLKLIPMYCCKFDDFVDLQGNDRSKFMSLFAFTKKFGNYRSNYSLATLTQHEQHYIKTNSIIHTDVLSILRPLVPSFTFQDVQQMSHSYIVLHVGSSPVWKSERLPVEKWQEFSHALHERYGLKFVLTGSADEVEYVAKIASSLHGEIENLAGKTTLQELKNLIKGATLMVATDSGPMHISASLGTPTIALFGASFWVTQRNGVWIDATPFGPWTKIAYADNVFDEEIKNTRDKKEAINIFKEISITNLFESL